MDARASSTRASIIERLRYALPALLVALLATGWVWGAAHRASWATLGRDQGIFQYIAWAAAKGDVVYRDVRDVNGPVVTMVHLAFQSVGGADEHRFRVLDLLVSGLTFTIGGAFVPSLRTHVRAPLRWCVLERGAWALAACVVLTAQYVVYGFWDTAQRESFLDWFVLLSIALFASRSASGDASSKRTALTLLLSGATSFIPWLGKPTFALFTGAQLLTMWVDDDPRGSRAHRLATFVLGGFVGMSVPLGFMALYGDLGSWARITFVEVPAMYRFIWPRPAMAILSLPGYSTLTVLALATSVGLFVLVGYGCLPRRAIPMAAMPTLGLVSVVVQAKGFPYHFHPVTLGVSFGWLIALFATWNAVVRGPWRFRSVAVVIASIALGARTAWLARSAPDPPAPPSDARDTLSLESPTRLSAFDRIDFFPRALRDAAEYVAEHTSPDDRVQMYGMDPYVLFLAKRRSATPFVYSYDLDVDTALHGSFDPEGPKPTIEQAERIRAMQRDHAAELLARLERAPPAAFVFVDGSPLMSYADAVTDFSTHCPDAARWLSRHYRQAADFDGVRVWLREADRSRSGRHGHHGRPWQTDETTATRVDSDGFGRSATEEPPLE